MIEIKRFSVSLLTLILFTAPLLLAKHRGVAPSTCVVFFSGSHSPTLTAETKKNLINEMAKYQSLLGLDSINDRPEHLQDLASRFKSLSADDKQKIMTFLKMNYVLVKMHKYSQDLPIKKLKRHFDFILSIESQAYEYFAQALQNHPEKWESVLQTYYNKQAQMAGLPKPLDTSNVLYMAYRLQEEIKSNPSFADATIFLYGSMVNGRSMSGISDLDYAVADSVLLSRLESLSLKFAELDNLKISYSEGHRSLKKQAHLYGFLNPIVIAVHANYIEIRIYKRMDYKKYLTNPEFFSYSIN